MFAFSSGIGSEVSLIDHPQHQQRHGLMIRISYYEALLVGANLLITANKQSREEHVSIQLIFQGFIYFRNIPELCSEMDGEHFF